MRKTRRVTLTLPIELIEHLKEEASELGIGYQTLIRIKLMENYRRIAPIKRAKGKPKGTKVNLQGKGELVSEMVVENRR